LRSKNARWKKEAKMVHGEKRNRDAYRFKRGKELGRKKSTLFTGLR